MSAMTTLAPGTGTVRIRSTFRQWAWLLGTVTAVFVLASGALAWAFSGTPARTEQFLTSSIATYVTLWVVGSAIVFRWQGVILTPDALRTTCVRGRFPGRASPRSAPID
ncbi:MAG: hypothetical protein WCF36_14645 [Candidatus Nanopelagicales bacterium]